MPLSTSQLNDLRDKIMRAEELSKTLDADINKARMAGLDVSSQQGQLAELQKNISQLKLHYLGK